MWTYSLCNICPEPLNVIPIRTHLFCYAYIFFIVEDLIIQMDLSHHTPCYIDWQDAFQLDIAISTDWLGCIVMCDPNDIIIHQNFVATFS